MKCSRLFQRECIWCHTKVHCLDERHFTPVGKRWFTLIAFFKFTTLFITLSSLCLTQFFLVSRPLITFSYRLTFWLSCLRFWSMFDQVHIHRSCRHTISIHYIFIDLCSMSINFFLAQLDHSNELFISHSLLCTVTYDERFFQLTDHDR